MSALKPIFRTALVTAGIVVLYQLTNLLLIYHYFRYEYGIAAAALLSLTAGIVLTKKYGLSPKQTAVPESPLEKLTVKERQILELVHEGKTNKEIAALNFVELTTVKTHLNNLYAKLEVNSRKSASRIYELHTSKEKSSFSPPPENT